MSVRERAQKKERERKKEKRAKRYLLFVVFDAQDAVFGRFWFPNDNHDVVFQFPKWVFKSVKRTSFPCEIF